MKKELTMFLADIFDCELYVMANGRMTLGDINGCPAMDFEMYHDRIVRKNQRKVDREEQMETGQWPRR